MKDFRDVGLCLLSAILLILAFPFWDAGYVAWVALVPLFRVLSGRGLGGGILLAFAWGNCFYLGIFSWILEIQGYRWFHHALLSVYLGSYSGIFGLGFVFLRRRLGRSAALGIAPFLWVALEYIRGNASFLALPWGFIGHTQYRYPLVIQSAALLGAYGNSMLIVLVNAGIAAMIPRIFAIRNPEAGSGIRRWESVLFFAAIFIFFLNLVYGKIAHSRSVEGQPLKVSVIQANIPQARKWDLRFAEEILKVYSDMTLQAAVGKPDMIVWPETAAPGSISDDSELFDRIHALAVESGTPLILGSAEYQKFQEGDTAKAGRLNSAFLIPPVKGKDSFQQYDKLRLFPFGEYLPYKGILPWEWIQVSSLGNYVPGRALTVFDFPPHRFAVTICWENIFPDLVRRFVKDGARFIVNITNEARFGKTAAPYQLMAISVFRAVENGVFVVRCANTGISCIIDPHGRIVSRLHDDQGENLFIQGILNEKIASMDSKTLYTRIGDVIPMGSLAACFAFFILASLKPAKGQKAQRGFP